RSDGCGSERPVRSILRLGAWAYRAAACGHRPPPHAPRAVGGGVHGEAQTPRTYPAVQGGALPVFAFALVLTLAFASGCMPTLRRMDAFSSRFPDNHPDQVREVTIHLLPSAAFDRPQNVLGVPLVAAVRQGPRRGVVLFDLSTGRQRWATDLQASSV